MNNEPMTDDIINALSLYKGKGVDDGLFSEWCEVSEELKSLRLHHKYETLIKKAMVRAATKRLEAYGEWVKDIQNDFATWDPEQEEQMI